MSLKRALESLPSDRETVSAIRDILSFLRRHPDEWLAVSRIASLTGRAQATVEQLLEALSAARVLRQDPDRGVYCYHRDTLIELEMDRLGRLVEGHSGHMQANVARFRDRYGSR